MSHYTVIYTLLPDLKVRVKKSHSLEISRLLREFLLWNRQVRADRETVLGVGVERCLESDVC